MSGSSRRNWSSVSAWPEPKSPTSARSAGVHMALSKQETTCNAAQQAGSARQTRPLTPSQTGTKAPQSGEFLGQVPADQRRRLVESADLLFQQSQVVQRVEDKVL